MNVIIGIDVGGSTTKIVGYTEDATLIAVLCVTAKDPITSVYGALGRFTSENNIDLSDIIKIMLTGVGASYFDNDIYGVPTVKINEFEAIGLGGLELTGKKQALVVSMGTGTAFVRATENSIKHIGGSGVGGGTIIGLCSKLTGSRNFDSILHLAEKGNLSKVDLSVGDISKNKIANLKSSTTASNFGKVDDDANSQDFVVATLNMVYQTIGMLAIFACMNDSLTDVVVTGMLTNAPQARETFIPLKAMYNIDFTIPKNAIFSTAIGAALSYFKNN